jgi:hypothetical protein
MSDFVAKLRARTRPEICDCAIGIHLADGSEPDEDCVKAADTIASLTAEVEKLKVDLAFADAQCAKVEDLFLGASKENEKLRSMLIDVVECWDWWQEDTEDHCVSVLRGAIEASRTEIFGGKK